MADRNFPGPYVNSTEKNDSFMKYVKSFEKMDIGARGGGMPGGDATSGEMKIEHVGNQNKK